MQLDKLIYPLFVKRKGTVPEAISSMPGVYKFSLDLLVGELKELQELGINKVLLFGVPEAKDEKGTLAYAEGNIICEAVRLIKTHFPDFTVITDVCLCAYTSSGHCGILKGEDIDQKSTLSALARVALSHAASGADFVAPSAMRQHQVKTIREALDQNGYSQVKILSYSAKFASNFYGPFREIADSAPRFGDRSHYQLDFTRPEVALERVASDIEERADIVMVKPALAYLDLIRQVKEKFNYPTAAYNVSGEYALVKHGVSLGLWDERKIVFEITSSIERAGADFIITYHAKDIARWS